MANTTNFNWETPDDTDLVKDGAAAMRTLGNSIDTSFVDLKGGTTGQILSKASNTDLDYTWVTTDDANAIQNAIVDAKGDLIAASAADTPARLAVGNDGETLVADSSTSTGLRYTAGTVQANPFLNSASQIWQRGTSISYANNEKKYGPDRWEVGSYNGSGTVSRQATGDTTNLPFIQYCTRFQRTAGQTATGGNFLVNTFETINSIPFTGKTITVSYYARKGADLSGTFTPVLVYGTGTDQNPLTGMTGQTTLYNTAATLTTTWQRFTFTVSVATSSTQLAFYFQHTASGTASTNDYFEVTGVQMDIGSVALPFRTYAATIQGELAACQRYFWKVTNPFVVSVNQSTTSTTGILPFPVEMRVAPTATYSSAGTFYVGGNSSGGASSVATNTAKTFNLPIDFGRSGLTAYNSSFISNNGTSTIEVSSEL